MSLQLLDTLKFNTAIRELFLHRFVQMFANYENFLILPDTEVIIFFYMFIKCIYADDGKLLPKRSK